MKTMLALLTCLNFFAAHAHAEIRYSGLIRNGDGTITVENPVFVMPDGSTPSIKLVVIYFNQNTYKREWIYTDGARAVCRLAANLPNPKVDSARSSVFIEQVVLSADGRFSRYIEKNFGSSENAYTSDAVTCSR